MSSDVPVVEYGDGLGDPARFLSTTDPVKLVELKSVLIAAEHTFYSAKSRYDKVREAVESRSMLAGLFKKVSPTARDQDAELVAARQAVFAAQQCYNQAHADLFKGRVSDYAMDGTDKEYRGAQGTLDLLQRAALEQVLSTPPNSSNVAVVKPSRQISFSRGPVLGSDGFSKGR